MSIKRNDGNISEKDEARTPMPIFQKLNAEFHFCVDVAANGNNALCNQFFAKEAPPQSSQWQKYSLAIDALKTDWCKTVRESERSFWVQPPYSNGNILAFAVKSYMESGNGANCVMLIPSDTSTKYFEFCFENASEIRFMLPRVKFNRPDGTPFSGSPPTGSMIVWFGPNCEGPADVKIWKWKHD